MHKLIASFLGVLAIAAAFSTALATATAQAGPLHKCTINGTVSYQQTPCPVTQPAGAVREPTLAELNAKEKERRAAVPATKRPQAPAASTGDVPAPGGPVEALRPPEQKPVASRCDGRTHCSQMRSCDEAKFFLANCPGVEMDGDRNGVPCEKQWCRR